MKLIVKGVAYDGDASPFIGDLRLVKQEFGYGWGTVTKRLDAMPEHTTLADLFDDPELNDAFTAWMWMTRRRAGERDLTLDEVRETPWDEIELDYPPAEPVADGEFSPDPTSAQTATALGDAQPPISAPRRASAKPKTSKPKSTRG